MSTTNITVSVDSDAARIFRAAPPSERAKLSVLISILLRELKGPARSIDVVMDELSERASSLGLTEERLRELLDAR